MNMTEILLKVALNTITLTPVSIETWWNFVTTTQGRIQRGAHPARTPPLKLGKI